MNNQLQDFARGYLKTNLPTLPESNQHLFKMMYARKGGRRSVEEADAMPIESVVDEMPAEKLDWAMQQVERTIEKARES